MDELEKKEEELRRLIQGKEKERVEMGAIHESVETIGSFLGVKVIFHSVVLRLLY